MSVARSIYIIEYCVHAHNIRFYGRVVPVKVVIEMIKAKLCHYGPGHALSHSRRIRFPEFLGSRDMKVVRLSALLIGSLYPPQEIYLVLISVRG